MGPRDVDRDRRGRRAGPVRAPPSDRQAPERALMRISTVGSSRAMRAACAAALMCTIAGAAAAQNTKSQLGTVSQLVAGTKIDLTYRRPVARGRELFGSLVPW